MPSTQFSLFPKPPVVGSCTDPVEIGGSGGCRADAYRAFDDGDGDDNNGNEDEDDDDDDDDNAGDDEDCAFPLSLCLRR